MKTLTILVILALLVFVVGCTQQQAQTPPANTGAPVANNPSTGDTNVDVPSDIVGDNPDTGAVQTTNTDASDLSS